MKFNLLEHRTKEILEDIYSDLWGLAKILSHGSCKYFVRLIDDNSRGVWVYFVKTKDETFMK